MIETARAAERLERVIESYRPEELCLLREENKQLRELVIQLSRLVIRNAVEPR